MNKVLRLIVCALLVLSFFSFIERERYHQIILWERGTGKYNNYRIPALIVTNEGTLLTFCKGHDAGNTGDINLLLKRSEDNGMTWSHEQVILDDANNTCGNPCPVADEEIGRVWLFTSWNNGNDKESAIINKTSLSLRFPYVFYSDDDGKTWSELESLGKTCLRSFYGFGRRMG